jgi:hypothetical protein
MYKMLIIEVIAPGKEQEDRAYREASQKLFDKYGVRHKVWQIDGRKMGQVLVEFGPFEGREAAQAAADKLYADAEWQRLQAERIAAGVVVPGTQETFSLND